MKKIDIQYMLKTHKQATINWNGAEYNVYPESLINHFLKDFDLQKYLNPNDRQANRKE